MSSQESTSVRTSPYCSSLRSKKLMFATRPAMVERDVLDASNHCWCARTQKVLGPDREPVRPELCGSDRSCFRSAFTDLS